MEATHGTWGQRIRTFEWDSGIATILYLEPWQRCSYHSHKETWNQFFVIEGELGVLTEKGYTTHLRKGQAFTVEPRVKHEFQTYYSPTIVEEIAYVKYNPYDIDRESFGGPLKEDKFGSNDKGQATYDGIIIGDKNESKG